MNSSYTPPSACTEDRRHQTHVVNLPEDRRNVSSSKNELCMIHDPTLGCCDRKSAVDVGTHRGLSVGQTQLKVQQSFRLDTEL